MKSAGKARSNGLYRHIRTSKEIIRNLLNYYYNIKLWEISHSFAARNFVHLYVVGGRQHSMGAVAKMQRIIGLD